MIDKKGKLFGKVSVIDLFVLVVVIVAVFFIYNNMGVLSIATPANAELMYISFETEQTASCVVPYLVLGARVVDQARGVELGRIVHVEVNEGFEFNPDADGNLVKSAKYGYSQVEITAAVRGVMNERGLWVDGNRYIVGHSMSVIAGNTLMWMRVSGLERSVSG